MEENKRVTIIKAIIMDRLDNLANTFKLVGMGDHENPRWMILYVIGGHDEKKIELRSTQTNLGWSFNFSQDDIEKLTQHFIEDKSRNNVSWLHDAWFREARNLFLKENHPTIELHGIN